MIWTDSAYDSGWNESLSEKIEARLLDIWLDMSLGPEWPKYSF